MGKGEKEWRGEGGSKPLVWAVHDGRIGIRNQVIGLTEAVGLPFIELRCRARFPWSHMATLIGSDPARILAPGGDALGPPWPDLLITCGRSCAAIGIAVKRASRGRTFLVQIQDPRIGRPSYDLMVVPEHDPARGAKVVVTRGAVHRVTPERLAEARERFATATAHLPAERHGAGLLVTASRRTGAAGETLLRERLANTPAFIWDGTGENPYFAFLALADAILVTEDSVSMVSEAASTGKPVLVIELDGGSRKFRAFHRVLREAGITRSFAGALEAWRYEALDDTARAAAEIRRRSGLGAPARMTG